MSAATATSSFTGNGEATTAVTKRSSAKRIVDSVRRQSTLTDELATEKRDQDDSVQETKKDRSAGVPGRHSPYKILPHLGIQLPYSALRILPQGSRMPTSAVQASRTEKPQVCATYLRGPIYINVGLYEKPGCRVHYTAG